MKKRTQWILSLVILVMILALTGTIARAAITSGSFLIKGNTLAGACVPGGQSDSASYSMTGAWGGMIGQSSSASYDLHHGCIAGYFIEEPLPPQDTFLNIFLPLIQK
jgi:hypothetical protein